MRRELRSILALWFSINLVWAFYRVLFHHGELVEELVIKPLVFVVPALVYIRHNERLTAASWGWRLTGRRAIFIWGGLFGAFLAGESIIVSLIKQRPLDTAFFTPAIISQTTLISLSTALSEEILYRGFLLTRFTRIWKSQMRANLVVSSLFSLAHLTMGVLVLKLAGQDLLIYLWSIFILGFADGFIYQQTGSVIAPIIAHTLWNFTNGFFVRN